MNKLIKFYSIILFIANTACGQSDKPQYSEVDFLKDSNKLFCWVGPFSGARDRDKQIRYMPLMAYNDPAIGQSRIICYPKAGFAAWAIKSSQDRIQHEQEVKRIAVDTQVQKQYDIYAFFVEAKNLIAVPDPHDPNAKEPKFPCPVYAYKKEGSKWVLLKKTDVKNYSEFADLKFDTVVAGKEHLK